MSSKFALIFLLYYSLSNAQDTLQSTTPEYLLHYAKIYRDHKLFNNAIICYGKYLSLKPGDSEVEIELARTLSWNQQFDSSKFHYEMMLRKQPENFDARYGLAQVQAWNQEYTSALETVQSLLTSYPQSIDAKLLAAQIGIWDQQFTYSLALYDSILASDSLQQDALLGKVIALKNLQRKDEAREVLATVRSHFPENAQAENIDTELRRDYSHLVVLAFENDHFDADQRTDHRLLSLQYQYSVSNDLKPFIEYRRVHRFNIDDQILAIGVFCKLSQANSISLSCARSFDARITALNDLTLEGTRLFHHEFSGSLMYRLLAFRNETAHIIAPGITWYGVEGFSIAPRVYASRTVIAGQWTMSYTFLVMYEAIDRLLPFIGYHTGGEAQNAIGLDNIGAINSWSVNAGCRYQLTPAITVRAGLLFLNRASSFKQYSFSLSLAYGL